jgi:hypothetical protein
MNIYSCIVVMLLCITAVILFRNGLHIRVSFKREIPPIEKNTVLKQKEEEETKEQAEAAKDVIDKFNVLWGGVGNEHRTDKQ